MNRLLRNIQFRRGTSAEWVGANPILLPGEPGFDSVLRILKIGDGLSQWNNLSSLGFAWVNVKDFGAMGDGIIDDTAAIQAAVNSLSAHGGIIFFPPGTYLISYTISVHNGVNTILMGCGIWNTVVKNTNTTLDAFSVTMENPVGFEKMSIVFSDGIKTSGSGIAVAGYSGANANVQSVFRDLFIQGHYDGINFMTAATWTIDRCLFLDQLRDGIVVANSLNADFGDSIISKSIFASSGAITDGAAIYYDSGGGLRIVNNKIYDHYNGISMVWNGGANSGQLMISNNSIDSMRGYGILLQRYSGNTKTFSVINIIDNLILGSILGDMAQSGAAWLSSVNIIGNQICRYPGQAGINLLSLEEVATALVEGNIFYGNASANTGIYINSGCTGIKIGTNQYYSISTPVTFVSSISGTTLANSVDRGDSSAWDFTKASFTIDAAWHDLDLSSIVPVGASSITFRIQAQNSIAGQYFSLRKKGNSYTYNAASAMIIVANVLHDFPEITVFCDTTRKIQYLATNGGTWANIDLLIKRYDQLY